MKTLLKGTEVTQCEEFVYLGGVVSADRFCDSRDRIGLADGIYTTFGKQRISASQLCRPM